MTVPNSGTISLAIYLVNKGIDYIKQYNYLQCGICYSLGGNIKKSFSLYNNVAEKSRVSWWPHHSCRSESTGENKLHAKGMSFVVKEDHKEPFNRKIGSFWITCGDGNKNGPPDLDSGTVGLQPVKWLN